MHLLEYLVILIQMNLHISIDEMWIFILGSYKALMPSETSLWDCYPCPAERYNRRRVAEKGWIDTRSHHTPLRHQSVFRSVDICEMVWKKLVYS